MTCTCHTSARPHLHHVDCTEAVALADAVSRHPANTSPAPASQAVEVATAPGPVRPVETQLSAGEAQLAQVILTQQQTIDNMLTALESLRRLSRDQETRIDQMYAALIQLEGMVPRPT